MTDAVPLPILAASRGYGEGILNVDKPAGMTSHDVVARVRRLTGQRKVGHAGTLDPMATGVLLLCLGRATRVAEYLAAGSKRYRATVRLGIATDTYDADGRVTAHTPEWEDVDPEAIEVALAPWRGVVTQVPPTFSAIKIRGRRAYQMARRGEPVSLQARLVTIKELTVCGWTPPLLTLELECSPGTYVRSIAHDLGQALGTGAHLAALVRLASGPWRIEDAVQFRRFETDAWQGCWQHHLQPFDGALAFLERVDVSPELTTALRHGQQVELAGHVGQELLRAYSPAGDLVAILRATGETGRWQPHKVFHS